MASVSKKWPFTKDVFDKVTNSVAKHSCPFTNTIVDTFTTTERSGDLSDLVNTEVVFPEASAAFNLYLSP